MLLNKLFRSKLFNKLFLFYLLAIFLISGIFVSVRFHTSFGSAKIGSPNSNLLHTNNRELSNYIMDVGTGYNWISSSTTSITIYLGDDDFRKIGFPFTFPFYDQEFTSVYISSNGWFSFMNTEPYSLSIVQFPSGNPQYAYSGGLFMCDLYPVGNIYLHSTNQYIAIEYRNIEHYSGGIAGSFEVVFYKSGIIKFQYNDVLDLGAGQSIGLNYGADLEYYNNFDQISIDDNNLAISFTYPGTYKGLIIGVSIAGGLVAIGGVIGIVFFINYRKTHPKFYHDETDFPLIYRDYVSLEQEAERVLLPEEKSILEIQDEIRELYTSYKNKEVIMLDMLSDQFKVEEFIVEEAFERLLTAKEIKGKLNIIAKEFVVKK